MLEDVASIVDKLFADPVRGGAVALLLLFVYLYLSKRKSNEKLKEKLKEEKQDFYVELFVFLNKAIRSKISIEDEQHMEKLIELDAKLKLFANDNTVKAWGDFWKALYSLNDKKQKVNIMLPLVAYGVLQLNLRKDLGSSGWISTLKWFDFSRSIINDLDNFLGESDKGYRTQEMKNEIELKQDG